ncbi:MAG: phenylalanine--tRNA ligase subunit beta [Gammaproteobacteria bacterium]|nr:phenylalanine--tRNA ligase subunit beta [Gammaproteobacteria bacterium]MCY4275888.1 phenylalanine--tRNA ligase subunit beta [Gammaproteobacteria bacterium]
MHASISWLKQWVDPGDIEKLTEQLTLAGLEVTRVESAGGLSDQINVVVGQIVSCVQHPDADRLQICEVDIGQKANLSIICGAPNARNGLLTACAKVGATLPNMHVESTSIRGIESQGMLCSAMELGLDTSSEGIIEFDHVAPVGQSVFEYLKLSDSIIEFELTPNRGDCLSILGIAREIAGIQNTSIQQPEIQPVVADIVDVLSVDLMAVQECPRYVGRVLCGVDYSQKTPDWMVERLRRSGLRNINLIVDITNYVMLEIGQPMHAFDLKRIRGGIQVRMASQDEIVGLLDGNEVKLDPSYLVIADDERAIALAGIMGGADTAITEESDTIFLEAAYFSADSIRGKARKLGMQTDASYRFERGVDPEIQVTAIEMATKLIVGIAGGSPGPLIEAISEENIPKNSPILLEPDDIQRVLGDSIEPIRSESILLNLGFKVEQQKEGWLATAPSWRFDIQSSYDLVEEVGRCFGYDAIEPRVRSFLSNKLVKNETRVTVHDIKLRMMELGYHEAVTYSFVDPTIQDLLFSTNGYSIPLKNPIAENMSVMRKSLWTGLLEAASKNLNRQEKQIRLFEEGAIFEVSQRDCESHQEKQMLAGVACGTIMPRQWASKESFIDFFDVKGDLNNLFSLTRAPSSFLFEPSDLSIFQPGQGADILLDNQTIGKIGKLHPAHAKQLDIDLDVFMFELEMKYLLNSALPQFTDVSRFPPVHRDLALVVEEEIPVKFLEDEIHHSAGNLLKNVILFDVFRGKNLRKNTKSMAFGLTFQSNFGNLTAQEIDKLIEKVLQDLKSKMFVDLRE